MLHFCCRVLILGLLAVHTHQAEPSVCGNTGRRCHNNEQCERRQHDSEPQCYKSDHGNREAQPQQQPHPQPHDPHTSVCGNQGRRCNREQRCERRQHDSEPQCYSNQRHREARPQQQHQTQPQPGHGSDGSVCGNQGRRCHKRAQCERRQGDSEPQCYCAGGYTGDGVNCHQQGGSGEITREDGGCQRPSVSHGKITTSQERFVKGNVINYQCDTGHKLEGDSQRTCLGNDRWSGNDPRCDSVHKSPKMKKCRRLQKFMRGNIVPNAGSYYKGTVVTYVCHHPLQLIGNSHRTCQENGQWSGTAPRCENSGCKKPGLITHGKVLSDQMKFVEGNIVAYQCNQGYKLMGKSQRKCMGNGQWSDNDPRCEATKKKPRTKTCQKPQDIEHGTISSNDGTFRVKAVITHKCREPYILKGNPRRTCQKNKKWSGVAPSCKALKRRKDGCQGQCHERAECVKDAENHICRCKAPFSGDGYSCRSVEK